jgi:ribosome-associated translation inhibitor RaiA
MQILIESPRTPEADTNAAQWRAVAERRLRFVMRRLRVALLQAHVRLEDVNGPRGGVDQRCQVHLTTDGHGTVVVHATRRHAVQALDAALKRAAHALVRLWQKQRRPARQHLRTLIATPSL